MIQQQVSVSMLKKSMDFQQQAALQLIQSLSKVQDPALGNNIDTYA
ncbi:MAG: YjfB family protein [Spirochaetales bacterium]|nr:YjfB family protein [Spirochaetales bacterium]